MSKRRKSVAAALLLTAALVVTAVVAVLGVVHPSSVARLAREP